MMRKAFEAFRGFDAGPTKAEKGSGAAEGLSAVAGARGADSGCDGSGFAAVDEARSLDTTRIVELASTAASALVAVISAAL